MDEKGSYRAAVKADELTQPIDLVALEAQGWWLEEQPAATFLVRKAETEEEAEELAAEIVNGGNLDGQEPPAGQGARRSLSKDPANSTVYLEFKPDNGSQPAGTATVLDKDYDATLFARMESDKLSSATLAKRILKQRHGLSSQHADRESLANAFQEQRIELMEQAVASAKEVNAHLHTWGRLGQYVPVLLTGTVIASFVLVFRLLALLGTKTIDAWELVLLIFVLSLMAVSPATLLLIGRPLKGLDEWSPSKTAEAAAGDTPAAGGADTPTSSAGTDK